MNRIILASASPRRRELLKNIFEEFDIIPADIDETTPESVPVESRPELIARKKAEFVAKKFPEAVVLGSDTAVIAEGEMLGKPLDRADAERMLRKLSGKTHEVITGCAVVSGGKTLSFSSVSEVEFYALTDEELNAYLETDEWKDKAGAYGIQGKAGMFVRGIRGDYNNVVGLPVAELGRVLKCF